MNSSWQGVVNSIVFRLSHCQEFDLTFESGKKLVVLAKQCSNRKRYTFELECRFCWIEVSLFLVKFFFTFILFYGNNLLAPIPKPKALNTSIKSPAWKWKLMVLNTSSIWIAHTLRARIITTFYCVRVGFCILLFFPFGSKSFRLNFPRWKKRKKIGFQIELKFYSVFSSNKILFLLFFLSICRSIIRFYEKYYVRFNQFR